MSSSTTVATTTSETFYEEISTIAVSQIALAMGYRKAHRFAVQSLADVLGRYVQSIATVAASTANSWGRTDSNLFDVIIALEHMCTPRGFPGLADPYRPLIRSPVLRDLMTFVSVVEDIPFAKPIPRCIGGVSVIRGVGFQNMQSHNHIPSWLPVFPVEEKKSGEFKKRNFFRPFGENWEEENVGPLVEVRTEKKIQKLLENNSRGLPKSRDKVRFIIGRSGKRGRVMVSSMEMENERDGFLMEAPTL
ncbi:hypothetical protein ZOSMA_113G00510 [Zostera marina]|uniref:Bromodomain associated domain-containing protein n=1 Tax=Zostera marina TaxID=29655 RepID=A0A0K9Q2R5_ZOSMR|nr:hypothetical protein ZOSMA_113G00510 [Zostera marina]